MKKISLFFIILVLFISVPLAVKAVEKTDVKKINQYIINALQNGDWKTTLDRNIYAFTIDVASLDEKISDNLTMREALKGVETTLFNKNAYTSQVIVYACLDESNCDDKHYSASTIFNLYKDDTKAFIYASGMQQSEYEVFQNAKKIVYILTTKYVYHAQGSGVIMKEDVKNTGEFTESPFFDNNDLPDYPGSRTHPYVVQESNSITLPDENDPYWDNATDSCVYFRFDFDSPTTYARYVVSPADIVNFKIYEATNINNLRADAYEEGLYQVSNQLLYAFCDDYGTTVNFTFKDTEKVNVLVDDGSGGDINLIPDNPNDDKPFNPDDLCGEDGEGCDIDLNNVCNAPTVARTLQFLGFLLFILKILVPAIIIIMGFVNLFKIITAGKPEEAPKYAKNIVLRVVIGIIIFLIPTLANFVFDTVDNILNGENKSKSFENCTNCILDTKNCKIYK